MEKIILWHINKNYCVIRHSSNCILPFFSYSYPLRSLKAVDDVPQDQCSESPRYAVNSATFKHSSEVWMV